MLALSLLHAVTAIILAIYGANALLMTLLYLRRRRQAPPSAPEPAEWPLVTVQAPIFNELHVVERLIQALAALDYPRDRLQIQLLDDSTDETTALAAAGIERVRGQGLEIELLHRQQRPGFKAGALAAAMPQARGEVIAIFDADFVPAPDFLRRTVPYLMVDPTAGFLQTRWSHLNAGYSPLTQMQALALDGHFVVEQTVRQYNTRNQRCRPQDRTADGVVFLQSRRRRFPVLRRGSSPCSCQRSSATCRRWRAENHRT